MRRSTLILLVVLLGLVSTPVYASVFDGVMLGSNEVPPNPSSAVGFTTATIVGDTLAVDVSWTGLTGGLPAAAHIHCCTTPGTNVNVAVPFTGFPALLSGTYMQTFNLLDASVYNPDFLNNFGGGTAAGAEAALILGLGAGQAYANIHNATYPGGEIRADLAQVPEPASALLLGAGVLGIAAYDRRRRQVV